MGGLRAARIRARRIRGGGATALGPHDRPPLPVRPPSANRPDILGLGCGQQLGTMAYSFITGFEAARFPIVDVQRQIVFSVFDFMRRGGVGRVVQGAVSATWLIIARMGQ